MNQPTSVVLMAGAAVALLALTGIWPHPPLLVWNASASVPIGLYVVHHQASLSVGDLVVVKPPEQLEAFLANGNYLPAGVPLIKHVAALAGSVVCRSGATITIDGIVRAQARKVDHAGRALPSWIGCRTVTDAEVFLLNEDAPASLDGRYFGLLPTSSIVGQAVPIWTDRKR